MRVEKTTTRDDFLRETIGTDPGQLHDIDFEDVALTAEALKMIRAATSELCNRFMPGVDPAKLTHSQCVGVFLDHCFWSEETGRLILCADIAERSICLPIPEEHWMVRYTNVTLQ